MAFVHSLSATPPPRHDGEPWTQASVEESADNVSFAAVEALALTPLDSAPALPILRHLTTTEATLESGYFRVVFQDGDGNLSPPSASVFSPGTDADDGYPTADALVAAAAGEAREALDALDDAELTALRRSAISAVEAWTHQRFVAEGTSLAPVTKIIDGAGTGKLYLPSRLAELTGLSISGTEYLLDDLVRDDSGAFLGWVDPLVGGSWVTRVRRQPGDPGPLWPVGDANVSISGVWGWTAEDWNAGLLDDVETAIRFDMEDQSLADASKLASTIRSARALGVSQVNQGGLSVALKTGEPGLSIRAQRKLLPFRWVVPVASVA